MKIDQNKKIVQFFILSRMKQVEHGRFVLVFNMTIHLKENFYCHKISNFLPVTRVPLWTTYLTTTTVIS